MVCDIIPLGREEHFTLDRGYSCWIGGIHVKKFSSTGIVVFLFVCLALAPAYARLNKTPPNIVKKYFPEVATIQPYFGKFDIMEGKLYVEDDGLKGLASETVEENVKSILQKAKGKLWLKVKNPILAEAAFIGKGENFYSIFTYTAKDVTQKHIDLFRDFASRRSFFPQHHSRVWNSRRTIATKTHGLGKEMS